MRRRHWNCLAASFAAVSLSAQEKLPKAEKHPVANEYHGVRVTDNYQWLEDGSAPAVKAWVAGENAVSRSYLDRLPAREPIRNTLLSHQKQLSVTYRFLSVREGRYFLLKIDGRKQQPMLAVSTSLDNVEGARILIDPNTLDAKGSLSMDWAQPSLDGKLVAVAISKGGSEDSSLHIYNVDTGKSLADVIPRVNYATAGGSVAWLPGGKSFLYTRYPAPGERPEADLHFYQQIYLHRIGTPVSRDTYVLGKQFPRIAEVTFQSNSSGGNLVAAVANGDGGEFEHFLRLPDGKWRQVTQFQDKIVAAVPGRDRAIYLLSRKNAPRGKILRLPLHGAALSAAQVVVPQSEVSIDGSPLLTGTQIYVNRIDGGPNYVSIYSLLGKPEGTVPVPPVSNVQLQAAFDDGSVLMSIEGELRPRASFRFDGGKLQPTALRVDPAEDYTGVVVKRAFASSRDGTRVPITMVYPRSMKLDGSNAALIYGYGGYGINQEPSYVGTSMFRLWIASGHMLVLTNLRGGSEYGEGWHQAGQLTHKQNVFDDFAACAHYLIDHQYTSSSHLAALGGSNGGLLMGAELTQHPDLFRAVVSMVGIYDMLRVELDPNGAFNVPEFGSVKDAGQFKALYAYSPYHHVDNGAAYPAVLFLTGDNDGRVNPAQSRKMTARLQEANASKFPILLRTSANSGHGHGSSVDERIDQMTDIYAFLFAQLGVNFHPPHAK